MFDSRWIPRLTSLAFVLLLANPISAAAIDVELVTNGLNWPTFVTSPPGDTDRLFVLEKLGTIRVIEQGELLPTPFLDISSQVLQVPIFDEPGLVGLEFHPDYDENGFFYVAFYRNDDRSMVMRYEVSAGDPNVANPASGVEIISQAQPHEWHNVNTICFGPDGMFYIGVGDGGPSGDPQNRAQNTDVLLGKILRIDLSGSFPYEIPPDNPFSGRGGARGEIWSLGLRNPYRFSFDSLTGDMYIGDVGQNSREEISFEPTESNGGLNFGWRIMEGTACHIPSSGCDPSGLEAPIYDYQHDGNPQRCAVTGGHVYRGSAIPALEGRYLFADWCSGAVYSFVESNGNATDFMDHTADLAPGAGLDLAWLSCVGKDVAGELYLIDLRDGELFKIVAEPSPVDLVSYTATADGEAITLTWRTSFEQDHLGFHVERSTTRDDDFERLTQTLIPARGASAYTYADETAELGTNYVYKLIAIDTRGQQQTFESQPVALQPAPAAAVDLHQNTPNPFNPSTSISFELDRESAVQLTIYDANGRPLRMLVRDVLAAAEHTVEWDGRDASGESLPSGTYFYELVTGDDIVTRKMVLLR